MKCAQGGNVYFLVMKDTPGLVKVGFTSGDVVYRVATLRTGNPYDLCCFDAFETIWPREVEHFVHRTHAPDMQVNEWLRCSLDALPNLVSEAKSEAARIEGRKSKEQGYNNQASNGRDRRPSREELRLHSDAQELMKECVPAQLRLEIAENRLKAVTGDTLGIPGIVRVVLLPEAVRFSAKLARARYPDLASQCCVEAISGEFRWRRKPQRRCFSVEYEAARVAEAAANASTESVLQNNVHLRGWTSRIPDLERWHDDFLRETRRVHLLDSELADLQTELTLQLRDYDALEGVCSFKRRSVPQFAGSVFRERFREKYGHPAADEVGPDRCGERVRPLIRKHVYTSRSYL